MPTGMSTSGPAELWHLPDGNSTTRVHKQPRNRNHESEIKFAAVTDSIAETKMLDMCVPSALPRRAADLDRPAADHIRHDHRGMTPWPGHLPCLAAFDLHAALRSTIQSCGQNGYTDTAPCQAPRTWSLGQISHAKTGSYHMHDWSETWPFPIIIICEDHISVVSGIIDIAMTLRVGHLLQSTLTSWQLALSGLVSTYLGTTLVWTWRTS
ncbi:hypothetical protein OBBRIDRAFT_870745 [Obba rivulosa]|uniref:Uncharacterized protein n=1 Tax=Obba rivulosa TaxID=1052685 RepID=A0A8E2DFH8_9APHY|nr:hypothetical protein OBBRIDRAFT_870745 [Obba rivulosa]